MVRQRPLDLTAHVLAPGAVGLVGQPVNGVVAVHADEPAGLEQRLGLGPQGADHLVAPGLDKLVATRQSFCGR